MAKTNAAAINNYYKLISAAPYASSLYCGIPAMRTTNWATEKPRSVDCSDIRRGPYVLMQMLIADAYYVVAQAYSPIGIG